jgi:hypothetical protein
LDALRDQHSEADLEELFFQLISRDGDLDPIEALDVLGNTPVE